MTAEFVQHSCGVTNHQPTVNKRLTSYCQEVLNTMQCLGFLADRCLGMINHGFSSAFRSVKPTVSKLNVFCLESAESLEPTERGSHWEVVDGGGWWRVRTWVRRTTVEAPGYAQFSGKSDTAGRKEARKFDRRDPVSASRSRCSSETYCTKCRSSRLIFHIWILESAVHS